MPSIRLEHIPTIDALLFCFVFQKVMMCEVATTIFKAYSLLRKKMPEVSISHQYHPLSASDYGIFRCFYQSHTE